MSLSINESIDLQFQCKGKWIETPHSVLPNEPMKENEKWGYCPMCWIVDFKDNAYVSSPEAITKQQSFKDSKINSNFVQCGSDTL